MISYARHGSRDRDIVQGATAIKRSISYVRHIVWKLDTRNLRLIDRFISILVMQSISIIDPLSMSTQQAGAQQQRR